MEKIVGYFTYEIFKRESYGVYRFKTSEDTIVVNGNFFDIHFDQNYELVGEYIDHPKYGFQFKVEKYQEILPNDHHFIIQYLSSDRFKGIGKKTAEVIYQHFLNDTLILLKENPHLIEETDLTIKQKQAIIEGFQNEDDEKYQTKLYLLSHGFNNQDVQLILNYYPENTISLIEEEPYNLYFDIYAIGFKKIDNYALEIGFDTLNPKRLIALMSYFIQDLSFKTGNVFHYYEDLKFAFEKSFKDFDFDYILDLAIEDQKIIEDDTRFYYFKEFNAENYIAKNLVGLDKDNSYDEYQIEDAILSLENELSITYDPLQKDAIHHFFANQFSLIVGGPGTGKTTIVKALVEISKNLNPYLNIVIAAPTGRAAKRISELCGVPSKTIHSLLLWDKETNTFTYNEKNPLLVDILIVDEFSMVDNQLFQTLLKASRNINKICIIGDDEQLPSINAGNVLNDLIESNIFPYTKLESNFRQSSNNEIIELANDILRKDVDFNRYHKDVVFVETDNHFGEYLAQGIDYYVANNYEFNEMQVLSPMYKGSGGIDRLNHLLQDKYNKKDPLKEEYRSGMKLYRENDKILQLKNYADDDVYNGDIGILEMIDLKQKSFIVNFDGIYVEYHYDQLTDITHAYAMSIHKAQGSEYPLVFVIVSKEHKIMLNKKLLYTAISRAKQKVVIVGSKEAFMEGISKDAKKRQTYLKERLLSEYEVFKMFFQES